VLVQPQLLAGLEPTRLDEEGDGVEAGLLGPLHGGEEGPGESCSCEAWKPTVTMWNG